AAVTLFVVAEPARTRSAGTPQRPRPPLGAGTPAVHDAALRSARGGWRRLRHLFLPLRPLAHRRASYTLPPPARPGAAVVLATNVGPFARGARLGPCCRGAAFGSVGPAARVAPRCRLVRPAQESPHPGRRRPWGRCLSQTLSGIAARLPAAAATACFCV